MAARRVLLLTQEVSTTSAVAAALASNGKLASGDVCRDAAQLHQLLEQSSASAALIDIDQPGTLSTIDPLVRRFSNTRFIVLSSVMDSARLLEAMQAGARHYLLKSSIEGDLSGVLHRTCGVDENANTGRVITVLSAGGGAGATTLAVNLANELQVATQGAALVVDMDTCYGAVGSYLGLDGEYGLADLLARGDELDEHLIETTAIGYSEKFSALISTAASRLGEAPDINPRQVAAATRACSIAFPNTVIDAARVSAAAAAELARNSSVTYLLMQLTVKDVRSARRMMTSLAALGVQAGSVIPLVTRYRKRYSPVPLEEARRALILGSAPLQTICNDFSAASQSHTMGKPLALTSPRSDLRKEIKELATKLLAEPAHAAGALRSSSQR